MKPVKILVVDDEPYTCEILVETLRDEGYQLESAYGGKEALEKFSRDFFHLVLLDIVMPKMDGMQVLKELKRMDPDVAVVMATVKRDVKTVVEAVKLGADDYIIKPFDNLESIITTVRKVLNIKAIKDENRYLKSRLDFRSRVKAIIGNSPKMQELYTMIEKVSPLNTTILLIGETGTGKELIAQAIHQCSPRVENKFISVNCGGIPETLLESTLFGYEKGAFTGAYKRTKGVFEEADRGTLFLDEIGETSPAMQVKLLRVLQDRSFQRVGGTETIRTDVRIVSATNKDLTEEVKKGRFREDLFYRLNVITLFVPPLRDRRDDIPLLAKYFLEKYCHTIKKNIRGFDQEAVRRMMGYRWQGNIRELENVVERAVALTEGPLITINDLPDYLRGPSPDGVISAHQFSFALAKQRFERDYLRGILERNGWNITQAAAVAGIPRQNFHLKIKKHQIKRREPLRE